MAGKKNKSDAQQEQKANRKWESKNRKKTNKDTYRRTARLFIRTHADLEDLEDLEDLIKERKENLKK